MKNLKLFLKVLIVALIIIIVACIIYKLILLSKAIDIEEKFYEALGGNYYVEISEIDEQLGYINQREIYYKDNMEKLIMKSSTTDEIDETEILFETYYDFENKKITYVYNTQKYAIIQDLSEIWEYNFFYPLYYTYYMDAYTDFSDKLWYIFSSIFDLHSITTEEIDGVECYKIETMSETVYVDKTTNLYVKTVSDNGTVTYEFSVGTVTEEDMIVPDLSDYVVTLR